MKITLFLFTFILYTSSYAGGFRFPNQPYSYAKLYLFNTHYERGRPDQHIYKNGIYAKTKVGNGFNVSPEMISKMNSIFKHGVDEIWGGLAKCSTPRHGIIFYNNKHQPIASISICFECDRVNFWSSEEMLVEIKVDNFDIKKAEKQMKNLKKLFRANNMHVYDNKNDYKVLIDNTPNFKNKGTMEIKNVALDSIFGNKITIKNIKTWFNKPITLNKDTIKKMTQSDAYYFYKYWVRSKNQSTNFIMSGAKEDSYLIQCEIYSPYIVLPNGVQIGMSLEDVMATFPVYDGIAYPEKITISGEKYKLEYNFKNQTLVKIVLYVWVG